MQIDIDMGVLIYMYLFLVVLSLDIRVVLRTWGHVSNIITCAGQT
jgi:hypothetical protein